uniref:Calmodulin-binding transcription activator 3 n=1 Tax=Lygus hesperus TaxID=30085 RepID=A0A0A9ZI48_LYGHE
MEWTDELTLEFLHLYAKEPVIWHPLHPDHKDRNIIHDGWKRIQSKLGNNCSVSDLKRKRENLMATYRKCVKKVETSCGTNERYKPEWFAFETMESFLHTIYIPKSKIQGEYVMSQMNALRETEDVKREPEDVYDDTQLSCSSLRSEDENLFLTADSPGTHEFAACDDENLQPSAGDTVQTSQQYNTTSGDRNPHEPVPTSTATNHQFTVNDDENPLRLQVGSSNIDDHPTVHQRPSKRQRLDDDGEDRFDIIGRTFAMKMRGLPKTQMLIAERLMNETMFRAEMGLLNLNYRLTCGIETRKRV